MRAAATATLGDLPAVPIVDPLERFTKHRRFNAPIARRLGMDSETADIARRIANCAGRLGVRLELPPEGPVSAHLETAMLCQCRLCPFCEWRRTRAWRARVIRGLTQLQAEHPTHRAVFLTLTVRNCALADVRTTINDIHRSWHRLVRTAAFPTSYWLRRTELTIAREGERLQRHRTRSRAKDKKADVPGWQQAAGGRRPGAGDAEPLGASLQPLTCHPHLHALLVVPPSYFSHGYIRQTRWREMWQMAARLDYAPIVDIRNVYAKDGETEGGAAPVGAVCEAAKYATKATDVLALGDRLPELHHQLRGIRMIGVSGALAPYVPAKDPEGAELLDAPAEGPAGALAARVAAVWDESAELYRFSL